VELQQAVILSVFAAVLILSALKFVHPAAVALAAALGLAVWLGPSPVLAGIRADVLLTAAGVMVLAGFFKRSGLTSWLALSAAKNAHGRPRGILVRLAALSFIAGALFGPAAAALVLPVALLLAVELDISPLPFIVTLTWSALLGGTAVLTAQPGNLWVGSELALDSGAWLTTMFPLAAAAFIVTLLLALIVFHRSFRATNERRARVLEYDAVQAIENKPRAVQTVIVLALIVIGLALQPWIHVEPVVLVLAGALVLSLLAGPSTVATALGEIDGGSLLWYGAVMSIVGMTADGVSNAVASMGAGWRDPLTLMLASALAGSFLDPGTIAGSLSGVLHASDSAWILVVFGAAVGGGATLWSSRTTALNTVVRTNGGPGWARVAAWGALFAVVNLLVAAFWLFARGLLVR